jgi:transposase-like protein
VTCNNCKVAMKELKGHIYHKKRKWRCPKCKRVRMQVHKPR